MSPTPSVSSVTRAFRHRGLTRALAAAWLVVHAFIGAAVPVLDAQLEAGDEVVAHWEDGTRSTCPTPHDSSVCRLCQLIGHSADGPAPRVQIATAVSLTAARAGSHDVRLGGTFLLGAHAPRAPPIA